MTSRLRDGPVGDAGRRPAGDRRGDRRRPRTLAVDVCIAVTDGAGHLLSMARMDRAPLLCVHIAQDKAYSVASFGGLPTSDWWRMLESEPALLHGIVKTDRLIVFGGGFRLWPTAGRSGRSASPAGPASKTSASPKRGRRGGLTAGAQPQSPMAPRVPSSGERHSEMRRTNGGLISRLRRGRARAEVRGGRVALQRVPTPSWHVGRAVRPACGGRGQADSRTWPTRSTSSCRAAARLRVVDEEVEVKAGTVISVDHGEEHRFVEVSEDLQMLVVFAPPDLPDEE